jgi:hypothetical protein
VKITILSEIDYAGSGHKLCHALQQFTKHDVKIITGRYHNKFKHPQNAIKNTGATQQRINDSDIIHLKGDFPPRNGYMGLKISHKPIIVSVSGSHFRKKEHGGHGYYKINDYNIATIKTAFTPDLCYPEYSAVWTPHPINSYEQSIEWKCSVHPILMHTPTRPEAKGTEFVKEVFSKLSKRMKIETEIVDNMPFNKMVEHRTEATIFFDQFKVGFYGNSAIEAMQYGIPTAAWISPQAQSQANGFLYDCPIITFDKLDADIWAKGIERILDGDMSKLVVKTKRWCNNIHSYQAVAKLWESIYNAI